MSEFYEGIEGGVPPVQTWCPGCGKTVIDPVVEPLCLECEYEAAGLIVTDDLQSEDR